MLNVVTKAQQQIAAIQYREEQFGRYVGDGPTSEQAADFAAALEMPVGEDGNVAIASVDKLWRSALQIEFAWLKPDADPLAREMIQAAEEVRAQMHVVLTSNVPNVAELLDRMVNLESVQHHARRLANLGWWAEKRCTLLLIVARPLNALGKAVRSRLLTKTAENLANSAFLYRS